jgi:hypothetical protein
MEPSQWVADKRSSLTPPSALQARELAFDGDRALLERFPNPAG